jgi:hypothetical protein
MITMYRNPLGFVGCLVFALVSLLVAKPASQVTFAGSDVEQAGPLRVGWASADLTPEKPVALCGFSVARISEGVLDPINATHTHCAPETRTKSGLAERLGKFGVDTHGQARGT